MSTATADDVGTIRSGLQKKAAGKWTLKYVCSHASQVSFQARMLDQFGRRLVFMDATFGVNKYGYPLYALVVSLQPSSLAARLGCVCSHTGAHQGCSTLT